MPRPRLRHGRLRPQAPADRPRLYPVELMLGWVWAISHVSPLSYEVDALRGLLLGSAAHLGADFAVLVAAAAIGITVASALLPRLAW
jgi:ABC-2 type transport system permease protein